MTLSSSSCCPAQLLHPPLQVIAQQSKLSAIAQQERAGRAEALRLLDQLRTEKDAAAQANESLWQHMAEVPGSLTSWALKCPRCPMRRCKCS